MEERYLSGNKVSIISIICNTFLLVIKTIIGFITGSQAMISDALNSGGDILNSIFTFIGNKIASKQADEDHNLGHGKAEYIYALLISIVIIYVSLKQIFSSFGAILFKNKNVFSLWSIVVCVITILVKLCLFIYVNKLSKKHNSILLKANAIDHRNDCVITLLNLISVIFAYFNIFIVDGIVGIIISCWILIVGIKIFKESYDVLMDKVINEETRSKIMDIVSEFKEIKKTNHFNSTPVGYRYQISLTIFVDGNLSTYESHDIANRLEKEIMKLDDVYLAIIHVNPYDSKEKVGKK